MLSGFRGVPRRERGGRLTREGDGTIHWELVRNQYINNNKDCGNCYLPGKKTEHDVKSTQGKQMLKEHEKENEAK